MMESPNSNFIMQKPKGLWEHLSILRYCLLCVHLLPVLLLLAIGLTNMAVGGEFTKAAFGGIFVPAQHSAPSALSLTIISAGYLAGIMYILGMFKDNKNLVYGILLFISSSLVLSWIIL